MDLNERVQARRLERQKEEQHRVEVEQAEKEAQQKAERQEWIKSGGRKRVAKLTAKLILLPVYGLFIAFIAVVIWAINLLIS